MDVTQVGRPGIYNQMAAHKILSDYLKMDDKCFKYFQEAFLEFREID
jgi:hypothetical protein